VAERIPRLLIATEFPPNASGGGPAVVRQMLREWPVENLFWWSCFPDRDTKFGQKVAAHRVARIPAKLYPHRHWCGQKSWLLEKIWTPWATRHFRKTLDTLRPDVVWVIPHGWSIPPVADVLPQTNIGFHVTIQDYMDNKGYILRYGIKHSKRLSVLADRLYANATTCDATSRPMIDDLQARTNREATQMLHTGLEEDDFERLATGLQNSLGEIRIAYAGTIVVERDFAFFVQALKRIRKQLPAPVRLDFFGDHSYCSRGWFDSAWMQEHGNFPPAELSRALRSCTWGFAPMGLTDDDPRYNRFSFPTKFISYLAAGLPIIALGHPESSVVKMATSYSMGLCVTIGDVASLSAQLFTALSDSNPGLKYCAGIQHCAAIEFDARRMRAILWECFQKCAARPK